MIPLYCFNSCVLISFVILDKSGDLNKKPKSSRKSMGNILRKDDESLISSQLKGNDYLKIFEFNLMRFLKILLC